MKAEEVRADYLVIPDKTKRSGSAQAEIKSRPPTAFTTARLGDVTESMKNGLYKPATEYGDDGMPCLRMYNIDAGQIAWRDIKRMRVTANEMEDYGLLEGDLLVNRVNSRELVGKTALIPLGMEPSVFESKNIRLRLKMDRALPKFINYQLLAFGRGHFANNAQQVVGMASVSQKQLADFPIVLAPLDQQKRIVAEIEKQFSRLDEAVANLKRVKANLKRYKAAVLKAAVEGRLVETEAELARREGRSYETGAQLLQRILETRRSQWQGKGKYKEPAAPDTSALPELPEGWVWAKFDQVTERVTKGSSPNWQGFEYCHEGIPFVRSQNVGWGVTDLSDIAYLPHEFNVVEKKSVLREGDVLLNIVGASIGRAAIAPSTVEGGNVNQAVAVIRLLTSGVSNQFVLSYLLSAQTQRRIHAEKVDVARANFSLEDIREMPLALPPRGEQDRIVAEVDSRLSLVRESEAQVDANLRRAERLRQSILVRSFNSGS
jgi:type I restriction enzyme S subunit